MQKELEILNQFIPQHSKTIVEKLYYKPNSSKPVKSRQIVVGDFPPGPDVFESEFTIYEYQGKWNSLYVTTYVRYVDPRDMDAIFENIPPSQLNENPLAEHGGVEDVYDFWYLAFSKLGLSWSREKVREVFEIDITEENPTGKFILRLSFRKDMDDLEKAGKFIQKLDEIWGKGVAYE